jgi:transmembrane sensor
MTNKLREFYEVEDFLTDESFTNYHFQLNTKDELSWKEWLTNHPEKNELVMEARELIQTLSLTISNEEYKTELKKIKNLINEKQSDSGVHFLNWNKNSRRSKRSKRVLQYLLPAILVLTLGGYFLLHTTNKNSNGLLVATNDQNKNLVITLSDSTIVTLAPKSVLHYPSHFQQQERNVYLQGDAQFHVKRNAQAPFKVYSENLVATVLGTIFNFKKSGDSLTVELISGKLNVAINDK